MGSFTSTPAGPDDNPLTGISFDLDKVTFKCEGRSSLFQMAEVIRSIAATGITNGLGMATVAESMLQVLGPAEYARFVDHFIAHETGDDVPIAILQDIKEQVEEKIKAATGRPTRRSSGSSPGEPPKDGLPARLINLGEPGGNLRILDGASPSDLKAAAEATRQPAQAKPPAAAKRSGGRPRRTAAS